MRVIIIISALLYISHSSFDIFVNATGENVKDCTPEPVTNLVATQISPSSLDVHLTWDPPNDQNCIPQEYYVFNNKSENDQLYITAQTNLNISVPQFCSTSLLKVLAVNNATVSADASVNVTMTEPNPFNYQAFISSLHLVGEQYIELKMAMDLEVRECEVNYEIIIIKGDVVDGPKLVDYNNVTINFDQGCNDTLYSLVFTPIIDGSTKGIINSFNYTCNEML